MLRLQLPSYNSVEAGDDDTLLQRPTITAPILQAVRVASDRFVQLLFCDISTHRRVAYLDQMSIMTAQARDGLRPSSEKLACWFM